ncbi:MAG: sigma-70 family RNA polymerase sigma factor [Marmoricola sp.]
MPLLHPATVASHGPTADEPSDAELIRRVRAGDVGSYGTLFARHRDAANRLARSLTQPADADDVVADAFAKVLTALQDGKGPDEAFRPYLLTAVRTCHIDRRRFVARVTPTDEDAVLDSGTGFEDPAVTGFESGAAAAAFRSLPERWQLVLWHLDVEGQKPAAVAPLLGMAPNAVSALAYRAREGLREAFLQQHAAEASREECRRTHDLLAGAVRGNLSRRDRKRVEAHLEQCLPCTALYLELTEVNSSLRALIAPVVLGGAAAAYLAGTTGSAVGGLGGLGALTALAGRARDAVVGNAQVALAAGATAAAAAAAVTGMVLLHTDAAPSLPAPQAQAPVGIGAPAPSGATPSGGTPSGDTGVDSSHGTPPPASVRTAVTPGTSTVLVPGGSSPAAGPSTGPGARPTSTPGRPSGTRPPAPSGPSAPPSAPSGDGSGDGSGDAPGDTSGDTSTVTVSARVGPDAQHTSPLDLGLRLGDLPAAHLASVEVDLLGRPIGITLP